MTRWHHQAHLCADWCSKSTRLLLLPPPLFEPEYRSLTVASTWRRLTEDFQPRVPLICPSFRSSSWRSVIRRLSTRHMETLDLHRPIYPPDLALLTQASGGHPQELMIPSGVTVAGVNQRHSVKSTARRGGREISDVTAALTGDISYTTPSAP